MQSGAAPSESDNAESISPNEVKRRKLAAIDAGIRDSLNSYFGERWIPHLLAERAKLPPNAPAEALWDIEMPLSDWYLREGKVDEAIATLKRLSDALEASRGGSERVMPLVKKMAVAHFRLAEQENCVCKQGAESCIFPLRDEAQHKNRKGAEAAAAMLTKSLEYEPRDLQCVWLLNLAHMALGTYPDGVPTLFRIPESRIESEYDIGKFVDIAHRVGIDKRTCAGGGCLDDFDGDGDLDVMTSSMEPSTPMSYYRNQGNGKFEDVSAQTGIDTQLGGLNFAQGDVNGDGRLDLYIPRGAWLGKVGEMPHSLLVQQADGTFLDTTTLAGLDFAAPSQVASFADVDNDGDLDLFVGCESTKSRTSWKYPSRLYQNDGQGKFEDVTEKAGVENFGFCKGAAFSDYDGDGFTDLYVSNLSGPNRLYHNQGDGTFVDRAIDLGVAEPIESFSTWWFDVNNDGWEDLFVTNYAGRDRTAEVCAYFKNGTSGTDTARIYLNQEGKGFRDATTDMALKRSFFPMGSNFGDFDNDGWLDMYLGTGDPDFSSLWPNVALRNDGGKRFQDVTTSSGMGHLQKGHGVSFGDVDQDGDQDVFINIGGAFRDDAFFDALFRNPGHGHHWTTVRLQGTESNRFAIGARIRVRIEEEDGERDIFSWVSGGSSFGCNSLQAEIGLAKAKRIVELEVRWPATGAIETFREVPLDRTIAITEGKGTFAVVETQAIVL
jgi:hypothetical protein